MGLIERGIPKFRNYFSTSLHRIKSSIEPLLSERITRFALVGVLVIIFLGTFGPTLAPYQYDSIQYNEDGDIARLESPSMSYPLGTTLNGYDVLSRLLFGARSTLIVGLIAGTVVITLGTTIGVTAGYMGGLVDSILMRFVDFMLGLPFIPFAIVLSVFFGTDFLTTVLILGLVLWRSTARVLRSQVLEIKQRDFILAARASGASNLRIIRIYILPNIINMIALFYAFGVGLAIIEQAGLAFLGMTDLFIPTWGIMLRNVYKAGLVDTAWWWSFPPGILISFTVLSFYLLGRGWEMRNEGGDMKAI